jgi:hypothetical protein
MVVVHGQERLHVDLSGLRDHDGSSVPIATNKCVTNVCIILGQLVRFLLGDHRPWCKSVVEIIQEGDKPSVSSQGYHCVVLGANQEAVDV